MEEKKFNVDFCDLTNENEKVEFLKCIFGERLYKALTEKRGFKFEVGQLYQTCYEVSLDKMKHGHKEVEVGNNYKRTIIPSPYIVDNLPSGEWNVIMPNKYNIPEHDVDSWIVGNLTWNADTGDFKLDAWDLDSDSGLSREYQEGDINDNNKSYWYCSHIVIAWKSPWKNQSEFRWDPTPELQDYMLGKFITECKKEFVECVEDN